MFPSIRPLLFQFSALLSLYLNRYPISDQILKSDASGSTLVAWDQFRKTSSSIVFLNLQSVDFPGS